MKPFSRVVGALVLIVCVGVGCSSRWTMTRVYPKKENLKKKELQKNYKDNVFHSASKSE